MFGDDKLQKAERHLNNGSQRRAYAAFRDSYCNPHVVTGGAATVLERGRQMRPKVTGGWEAKWDAHLARLDEIVSHQIQAQPTAEPATMLPDQAVADLNPYAELLRTHLGTEVSATPADPRGQLRPAPGPDTAAKACPDCAESVRVEARKCRYCGYEFSKTCPECAEDVRAQARKCRHCGYRFVPEDGEADAVPEVA